MAKTRFISIRITFGRPLLSIGFVEIGKTKEVFIRGCQTLYANINAHWSIKSPPALSYRALYLYCILLIMLLALATPSLFLAKKSRKVAIKALQETVHIQHLISCYPTRLPELIQFRLSKVSNNLRHLTFLNYCRH